MTTCVRFSTWKLARIDLGKDIRSAHDAHVVFEAVRLGCLPMVSHRLSTVDCECLRPGQVFCWEQDNGESGIERWTDGRKWSSSRARDNFLFYIENVNRTGEDAIEGNYQIDNRRRTSWDFRHDERSSGFTKQTYSAWVVLDPNVPPRRWNLTAYFSAHEYLQLPTIETDPLLSQLAVHPNVYTTVQSLLRKSERRSNTQDFAHGSTSPTSAEDIQSSGIQTTSLSREQYPSPGLAFAHPPTGLVDGGGYQQNDVVQAQRPLGHTQPRSLEDQRAIAAFRLQL